MTEISVSTTTVIDAPPAVVYGIIADYNEGHPQIVPQAYFGRIFVDRGGVGAGTRIRAETRMPGGMRIMTLDVSEPEPGRVLKETEVGGPMATTFTVDPLDGGRRSSVTIETRWKRGGIQGFVERWIAPPLFRRVYAAELKLLGEVAKKRSQPVPAAS